MADRQRQATRDACDPTKLRWPDSSKGARGLEPGVSIAAMHVPLPLPRMSFSRSFVFNNISGCTFIFEEQKPGVGSQEPESPYCMSRFPYPVCRFPVPLFSITSPDAPSFLKSRSQELGARSQHGRDAYPVSPTPCPVFPCLCFHTHSGLERRFCACGCFWSLNFGLRTWDFGLFFRHLPPCLLPVSQKSDLGLGSARGAGLCKSSPAPSCLLPNRSLV